MHRPLDLPRLTSWLASSGGDQGGAPSQLKGVLLSYLLEQRPFGGGAHLGLVGVVVVLLWGSVPPQVLFPWAAGIATCSLLCAMVVRRGLRNRVGAMASLRFMVLVTGVMWGGGGGMILRFLPEVEQWFLVVALVGLSAGSAVSLLADPVSFALFQGALAGGLLVAATGANLGQRTVLVITVLVGALVLMSLHYRRSHGLLRRYLRASTEADAATREAERQRGTLDAILTNAPTAMVITENNDRVLGVNAAFERMFRCRFEAVNGLPLCDVVLGDAGDTHLPELVSDLTPTEQTRRRHDGVEVRVLVSSGMVRDDQRGIRVVVYEDLSSVVEAHQVVEEAKEQYRQLVEASPDLVWRGDRQGRWTFVNEAARALYEIAPADLIGRPIAERVDSHGVQSHEIALKAVLAGAELVDHRATHCDAGGRLKHLSISMRPLLDADGVVIGAQGVARDITVVVDGIAALEETRAEAERYAASRSRFLANVSHEVRTPLNGLMGMTEILRDTSLDQEQRRSVDLIQTSAAALLSILNDVLDYSKIEAGGMVLEPVSVDLTALVDSVVRLQAVAAFEKRLELVYDIEPEVPRHIVADPGRLRQVLSNLLANAVKFTEKGEIVVRVSCAQRHQDHAQVTFSVRDTGIGIARDRLQAIFDEYVQGDASVTRRYGGTGLGLAIARRLVRMMGGDIVVESGDGTGSLFQFAIRVECKPAPQRVSTRSRVALFGERVLVVGSNGASRSMIVDQLRRAGLEVSEAADRVTTTAALDDGGRAFAAIVIDAHVAGGSDGFTVADWIVHNHPGTPLMMLTAAGQRGDAQRCRDLGVAAYLTKPIGRTELLEVTASVVSGRYGAPDEPEALITRYTIAESRQPVRVLYAEDNPVNRTVAVSMLEKRGHDVTAVVDGESAIREWVDGRFDVVLMDINLPGLNGVETMRQIRDMMTGPDVPVIAVTAHGMPGHREEILAEGFDRVLLKPFGSAELFAAVEGWDAGVGAAGMMDSVSVDDSEPVQWDALLASMREANIVDALPSIVSVFCADAPHRMAAIRHAVVSRDAGRVRLAAHAFRSAAGTIKAVRLAALLHDLERDGRDARPEAWPGLVRRIDAELARVRSSLAGARVGR